MGPLVINNQSRHPIFGKNIFPQKFHNHSRLICPCENGLNSLRHVVHTQKYVLMPKWTGEWSHKINTPNIKNVNHNNRIKKWHHVPLTNPTQLLAPRTMLTILKRVPKQSRPIKTTLNDFSRCFLPTEMPPKCLVMTKWKDTSNLMVRHTPPKNLVRTIL